jgi:hypothetical protein
MDRSFPPRWVNLSIGSSSTHGGRQNATSKVSTVANRPFTRRESGNVTARPISSGGSSKGFPLLRTNCAAALTISAPPVAHARAAARSWYRAASPYEYDDGPPWPPSRWPERTKDSTFGAAGNIDSGFAPAHREMTSQRSRSPLRKWFAIDNPAYRWDHQIQPAGAPNVRCS